MIQKYQVPIISLNVEKCVEEKSNMERDKGEEKINQR